ncbi:MAG: glycosyltransferase family 4 protein [Arenicellales bacterium]
MKKKKLLLLITRSEPGGAQSHVLELLHGLRNKYELILATGEDGFLLDHANELGIESYLLPSLKRKISPIQDYRAYQEIRNIIQQIKPDLVHTHSSKAGILGRLAARRLGIRNIFTAHGWAFADGTPWVRKLIGIPTEYIAGKWCDQIITVSHADKKLAVKHHIADEKKISVIHNGITDIEQNLIANPVNQPPILTMVARVAPPKNFVCLLDALALIDGKYLLRVVGDGPELIHVQEHANKLGIEKNIDFMGSRDDVPEILASSDIFILSSDWEGFPISIIEAMRASLPIIASNVGGISEAVIEGRNGYLVPRADVESLSKAIRKLVDDTSKRVRMGKNSRQLFVEQNTTASMLRKVDEIYSTLLS